ncbi:MAG: PIN domain-containing protein [Anaerolineae bacterium]|nr:PIN domain-containing protein [Anaerolineae bacterium]
MNRVLVDSNFLYSLYNPDEKNHQNSQAVAAQKDVIAVIPEIILAEVTFLFYRHGGVPAVALFLQKFAKAANQPISLTLEDIYRAGEIVSAYPKAELDFVDCAIMALSERLNITRVCTYDRRDFVIFRPKHCPYLELLP